MQIKLFQIPLIDDGTAQAEINRFLAGHKVLEVEQQFFQNEKGACWSFCVRYLANAVLDTSGSFKGKKDYRALLPEHVFHIFSSLREIRKQLANEDAVPAYAVFTDEELASIASLSLLSLDQMRQIKGIGDKKIEKYGKSLVTIYEQKKNDL